MKNELYRVDSAAAPLEHNFNATDVPTLAQHNKDVGSYKFRHFNEL